MLLNDPVLYGATLPYSDIPIPSHWATPFSNPWQQPKQWQVSPWQMTPWQNSWQMTPWQNSWQMTPWQMSQWSVNPWQVNPWATTSWQDVNNYLPPDFGLSPYQQYQSWQPFPTLQHVPPITPWLQRPIPFAQPYNLNRPCNWQRPPIF